MSSASRHLNLAKGIGVGLLCFVLGGLLSGFISAPVALILGFNPRHSWWQGAGYFLVTFVPVLMFVFLGSFVAYRQSGRLAAAVVAVVSLGAIVGGIIASLITKPW